jgi:hypothetical protein
LLGTDEELLQESDADFRNVEDVEIDDEEMSVLEEEEDNHHGNYLEEEEALDKIKIEVVDGEKAGSKWLIIEDIYIMHKKQSSANEEFWDCSGRLHFNCSFKCSTYEDSDGGGEGYVSLALTAFAPIFFTLLPLCFSSFAIMSYMISPYLLFLNTSFALIFLTL